MKQELLKFDVLCLNETSTAVEELPFGGMELEIDGFHAPFVQNPIRASARGGGLAIYVNKQFINKPI